MKSLVMMVALMALLVCRSVFGQELCTGNSHWDIPGRVMDRATHTVGARDNWRASPAEISTLVATADVLLRPILNLDYVSHPKGLQVGYYRAVGTPDPGNMTLESQPFPLKVEAMIFGFFCSEGKVHRRWSEADAGLAIEMNSLFELLDNTTMKLNGKKVYLLHFDLGEYRGYKSFAPYTNNPVDDSRYVRALLIDTDSEIFVSPKIDLSQDCYPRCSFGQYLVMPNEQYYDKRLPKTAPQLFVVEVGSLGRRKELNPYQLRIRDQSLADIDLNALVALLPK